MVYELLIPIATTLISSFTTIVITVLVCARLESLSLVVRSRRGRKRRYPVMPRGRTELWSDRREDGVDR